jgi:transcriptional regulator with XRE-family HTH domain
VKKDSWLDAKLDDPEVRRALAREEFIEGFLMAVEQDMRRQGISRSELARRLGCRPANITQIMSRTRNLTAATMVEIALALSRQLRFTMEPLEGEPLPVREPPAALRRHWRDRARSRMAVGWPPGDEGLAS